jgi:hypothetical protein
MRVAFDRLVQWFRAPARMLFGRDVFISYARKDAAGYAAALARELSKTHTCYLDQHAAPRGDELPRHLRRDLRRASAFILILTRAVRGSRYVEAELEAFLRTGRKTFPIAIDEDLPEAGSWRRLSGVYRYKEAAEAFAHAVHSLGVSRWVRASLIFTRQETRLRCATLSAVCLIVAAFAATDYARRNASAAMDEASIAKLQATQAFERVTDAEHRRDEADRGAAAAGQRATAAQNAEAVARARAVEQQRIADSRRISGLVPSVISARPDVGLLLAAQGYQMFPPHSVGRLC